MYKKLKHWVGEGGGRSVSVQWGLWMYSTAKPKLTHTGDLNEAGAASNFSLSTPLLVLACLFVLFFPLLCVSCTLNPAPVTTVWEKNELQNQKPVVHKVVLFRAERIKRSTVASVVDTEQCVKVRRCPQESQSFPLNALTPPSVSSAKVAPLVGSQRGSFYSYLLARVEMLWKRLS